MLCLLDNLTQVFDARVVQNAILIDFSKAFDRVPLFRYYVNYTYDISIQLIIPTGSFITGHSFAIKSGPSFSNAIPVLKDWTDVIL